MKMSMRWFGEAQDTVKLWQIRQIPGLVGIISTLYDALPGQDWPEERIKALKHQVEEAGLKLLGIESVNVHDDIKVGAGSRDQYIENYIRTIEKLGRNDIHLVCYNFMPVFDWVRSDLFKVREDGATVFYYDQAQIDQIVPEKMFEQMGKNSGGYLLPGWEPERMANIKRLFELYQGIDETKLFDNLVYFPVLGQLKQQAGQRHPGHHPLLEGPRPLCPPAQHQTPRPRRV